MLTTFVVGSWDITPNLEHTVTHKLQVRVFFSSELLTSQTYICFVILVHGVHAFPKTIMNYSQVLTKYNPICLQIIIRRSKISLKVVQDVETQVWALVFSENNTFEKVLIKK